MYTKKSISSLLLKLFVPIFNKIRNKSNISQLKPMPMLVSIPSKLKATEKKAPKVNVKRFLKKKETKMVETQRLDSSRGFKLKPFALEGEKFNFKLVLGKERVEKMRKIYDIPT